MSQAWRVTILCLLAIDALIAWAWVIRYSRHPWRASAYGRHLMRFSALVSIALTATLAFAVWQPHPLVGTLVSAAVYVGLGAELVNRHRLLSRADEDGEPPRV